MTADRHLETLDESVCLRRTEKARAELLSAQRVLGRRERGVLFLCDGLRSIAAVRPVAGENVAGMMSALIEAGYLEIASAPAASAAIAIANADPTSAAVTGTGQGQGTTAPELKPVSAPPPSLAESRMFLFDLLEITLVRSAPWAADQLREQLREARDGQAMLLFVQEFLGQLESAAGADRARTVRRRISERMPDVHA